VIDCRALWKIFGKRAGEALRAVQERGLGKEEGREEFDRVIGVRDASFAVQDGEIFCIMGLSGSGKSTLICHINRLGQKALRGSVQTLSHFRSSDDGSVGSGLGGLQRVHGQVLSGSSRGGVMWRSRAAARLRQGCSPCQGRICGAITPWLATAPVGNRHCRPPRLSIGTA
jgi:hypothetical protein